MTDTKGHDSLVRVRTRISVRFGHTILPFDLRDFSECLTSLGYQLKGDIPPEQTAVLSAHVAGEGIIADKGEFEVDISTSRQFFGVAGGDPSEAAREVRDILETIESKGLTSKNKISFYETQALYRIIMENAAVSMRKHGETFSLIPVASKTFGIPLGLFGTRLTSIGEIDSPDYFEIQIQPSILRPDHEFGVRILYRNHDLGSFQAFVDKLEGSVSALISQLEA